MMGVGHREEKVLVEYIIVLHPETEIAAAQQKAPFALTGRGVTYVRTYVRSGTEGTNSLAPRLAVSFLQRRRVIWWNGTTDSPSDRPTGCCSPWRWRVPLRRGNNQFSLFLSSRCRLRVFFSFVVTMARNVRTVPLVGLKTVPACPFGVSAVIVVLVRRAWPSDGTDPV